MASQHRIVSLLLAVLALTSLVYAIRVDDTPFSQLQVKRWLFAGAEKIADWEPLEFPGDILQIASIPGSGNFWILTSESLYFFNPNTSSYVYTAFPTASSDVSHLSTTPSDASKLTLAGPTSIHRCAWSQLSLTCRSVDMADHGPLKATLLLPNGDFYVASDKLYLLPSQSNSFIQVKDNANYTSLAYSSKTNTLAVGTDRLLWINGKWGDNTSPIWRYFRVDGIIDDAITSLAFGDDGTLFIGNKLALNTMNPDWTFGRYGGGPGGLPYGNITSIAVASNGAVWMGTTRGVIRFYTGKFRYFNGPRYLTDVAFGAGNAASSVVVGSYLGQDAALVLTGTGLSWFSFSTMTMASKADYFQTLVHPYHGRFGLVSASRLDKFGDLSSYALQDSENDGLWTSMYLASQALRYAVTQDPDAKKEADAAIHGLQLLNNVTGVKGLFARSVLRQDTVPGGHLPWYQSTTMPGWVWQADTSSDEVTGHILGYTMYYQFVASTDEEKELAASLITNCLTYIVQNDLYLMDVTGQRTTWGVWNPTFINDNPDWFDQRGLNSIQIMAWLSAASEIASKSGRSSSLYDQTIKTLKSSYQYDLNIINAKIPIPTDDNYSDDELQHMPIYTYLASNSRQLDDTFYLGCDRTFNIVKTVHSPLWNFIYGASVQSRPQSPSNPSLPLIDLINGVTTLQQWPLSWIDWPIDNTQRMDILISQYPNRRGHRDLVNLLPYDEIPFYRWNTDPFEYRAGGSGFSLAEPTAYLLPYWLGRYHKLISPPAAS